MVRHIIFPSFSNEGPELSEEQKTYHIAQSKLFLEQSLFQEDIENLLWLNAHTLTVPITADIARAIANTASQLLLKE